jgi:hypothetical protein
MAKVYEGLDERLIKFIQSQRVFFVGTAPNSLSGHVNVSPKGLESLRILDPKTIAYLDHTGSGAETIAHLRENRRIVIMFCAFEGAPQIVRLHGHGKVVEPQDEEFGSMRILFGERIGVRSIIHVRVERVSDSCGYSVPRYKYEGQRSQLDDWADHKGTAGIIEYQATRNSRSIDGLPALRWPENQK